MKIWRKSDKKWKKFTQNTWKIVRGWHHQLTHLHIHIDCSRNVSLKIMKIQNFLSSLFFIFTLNFAVLFKICYSFFWINLNLDQISPLKTFWPTSHRFYFVEKTRLSIISNAFLNVHSQTWELILLFNKKSDLSCCACHSLLHVSTSSRISSFVIIRKPSLHKIWVAIFCQRRRQTWLFQEVGPAGPERIHGEKKMSSHSVYCFNVGSYRKP